MGGHNPLAHNLDETGSQRERLEIAREVFKMFALERYTHLILNAITFVVLIYAAIKLIFGGSEDRSALTLVCGSGGLIAFTSARLLQMWTDILNRVFGKLWFSMVELSKRLSEADLREARTSARKATVLTLLSGIVVLASFLFGAHQISDRHKQIITLDGEIATKQAAYQKIESQVNSLEKQATALRSLVAAIPGEQVQQAISNSFVDSANLPARVYIHIANENQRSTAEKAAASLRAAGFLVPGIEYVGSRGPIPTQLRYFKQSDENGSDLPRIMEALNNAGIKAQSQYLSLPSSTARPRHFELWFGKAA
jgi:hypothetical protein